MLQCSICMGLFIWSGKLGHQKLHAWDYLDGKSYKSGHNHLQKLFRWSEMLGLDTNICSRCSGCQFCKCDEDELKRAGQSALAGVNRLLTAQVDSGGWPEDIACRKQLFCFLSLGVQGALFLQLSQL